MSWTVLLNEVTKSVQYVQITCTDQCGQLTVDIDEPNFTDAMNRQLEGILFRLCTYTEGQYVPIDKRSVLWNIHKDQTLNVYDIPDNVYLEVQPIIDRFFKDRNPGMPESAVFPIKILWNGDDVSSSDDWKLDGDIEDNLYSNKLVSAKQVVDYVANHGGGGGGGSYVLPIASDTKLGGIKVGENLSIDLNGKLSAIAHVPSDSEDVSYDNPTYPELSNVELALNKLMSDVYYVDPSITLFKMTPSTTQYEIGSSIAELNFEWTYNKEITSQTLTDCTLADNTTRSAVYDTELSSNKTFTLSASDGKKSVSSSKTIQFLPKVYYGASVAPSEYDSNFITSLSNGVLKSSKAGTYTSNVDAGKYMYIAVPTTYGDPATVKIGGFDTELTSCGTISVTNASGYTQNYYLRRTPNPSTGSTTMVIS